MNTMPNNQTAQNAPAIVLNFNVRDRRIALMDIPTTTPNKVINVSVSINNNQVCYRFQPEEIRPDGGRSCYPMNGVSVKLGITLPRYNEKKFIEAAKTVTEHPLFLEKLAASAAIEKLTLAGQYATESIAQKIENTRIAQVAEGMAIQARQVEYYQKNMTEEQQTAFLASVNTLNLKRNAQTFDQTARGCEIEKLYFDAIGATEEEYRAYCRSQD